MTKCLLLVSTRAFGIVSSRLRLVDRALSEGWDVVVASQPDGTEETLTRRGARFCSLPLYRGWLAPSDFRAVALLRSLLRKYRPELSIYFNLKPIVLGSVAEAFAGTNRRRVNVVTGLGSSLSLDAVRGSIVKRALSHALASGSQTIFQNRDDLQFGLNECALPMENVHLILSSGVDLHKFSPRAPAQAKRTFDIALISRLLWTKGVGDFVEAARLVSDKTKHIRFILGGEWDPKHKDAIPLTWVDSVQKGGLIDFVGYVSDVPRFLDGIDAFVFPSRYREGVPRVILEAAAASLPVIASDSVGCREAVIHQKTGLLVPAANPRALADAILALNDQRELAREMGREGRRMIETNFDQRQIIDRLWSIATASTVSINAMEKTMAPSAQ